MVIAPLSDITLKAADIMQLRVGFRLTAVLALVSSSAVGNIFLFANMYEGRRTTFMMQTAMFCGFACVFAGVLEMFHIAWRRKRRDTEGGTIFEHEDDETDLFEEEEDFNEKRLPLNKLAKHKHHLKRGTRSSRSSNHSEGSSSLEYSIKDRNLMSSSISDSVGLG